MQRAFSFTAFRFRTLARVLAALSLVLLSSASNAIREASIASYVSVPHAGTSVIMRGGLFAFAGGVIPRGDVAFFGEDERAVNAANVELIADPSTGRTSVKWAGKSYDVLIQKSLACPLARYVQSGTVIAFTIAHVKDDRDFLERQGMLNVGGNVYVARELGEHVNLLGAIDLAEGVEPIADKRVRDGILGSMNRMVADSAGKLASVGALAPPGDGTFVNADFNVTYQAHLAKRGERRFVDFAGLPLRYYWTIGEDGKTPRFEEVETFAFPTEQDRKQILYVTFFQNAALMRRFKLQNKTAFASYVQTVCAAR